MIDKKIKGTNNLVKRNKGTIINIDSSEYAAAKDRLEKSKKIEKQLEKIDSLEKKMSDVEKMLKDLIGSLRK